jgi:hypothetical protein
VVRGSWFVVRGSWFAVRGSRFVGECGEDFGRIAAEAVGEARAVTAAPFHAQQK